jgi:hypothetical protein
MARHKFFIFSSFAAAVAIGIAYSAPVSAQETYGARDARDGARDALRDINGPEERFNEERFKIEQTKKFAENHDEDRHHGPHCMDGDHDHDHDCHRPVSP